MEHGYGVSRTKASSKSTVALDRTDGDRIFVSRLQTGHWVYWSPNDAADKGSVIVFIQRRTGATLGAVRQLLRPRIGRSAEIDLPERTRTLKPVELPDRGVVVAALRRMRPAPTHPYLIKLRRIPAEVLQGPRFLGKVLRDARGNAIFPHIDRTGVSGYEMKNVKFTGFSKRGTKGLWMSALHRADRTLVITETAIDALSHAALHPDPHARYASTGGSPRAEQLELIAATVLRLPAGAKVLIATDADRAGDKHAEALQAAVEGSRSDAVVQRSRPPERQDWNDVLCEHAGPHRSPADGNERD